MKLTAIVIFMVSLGDATFARAAGLEPLYPAPAFKSTDQDGRTVTNADLGDKTWVVNFIFTRCGGACPLITRKMVNVARKVPGNGLRFVSISVDPEYDTPAILKRYAA